MILPRIFTVFTAYLTPSGKIYHNRRDFFCAKQQQNEKPEQQWRKFRRIEKVLEFKNITFTELTVSNFITSFTVTKVREAIPDETENTLTLVMNRKKQAIYDKSQEKFFIPRIETKNGNTFLRKMEAEGQHRNQGCAFMRRAHY